MKRFAMLLMPLVFAACASKTTTPSEHPEIKPDPMPVATQINGMPEAEVKAGTLIDREGIRQVFLNNQKYLQECYVAALKKDKSLSGKMVIDLAITDGGKVTYAKVDDKRSTLKNKKFGGCVVKGVKSWTFPEPPPGQTVQVYYPVAFSGK